MPAGFRRHLVGKTPRNVCHCRLNALCWQVNDHTDIFVNERIEFCLNSTINLRPLTPHIMPCYTHKMAVVYRDHRYCDVTSPCVYRASIASRAKSEGARDQAACVQGCSLPLRAKGKPPYQLPHCINNTRARRGSEINSPVCPVRLARVRRREFKVGGDEPCEPTVRLPD